LWCGRCGLRGRGGVGVSAELCISDRLSESFYFALSQVEVIFWE
jgi:hypothetical protein